MGGGDFGDLSPRHFDDIERPWANVERLLDDVVADMNAEHGNRFYWKRAGIFSPLKADYIVKEKMGPIGRKTHAFLSYNYSHGDRDGIYLQVFPVTDKASSISRRAGGKYGIEHVFFESLQYLW